MEGGITCSSPKGKEIVAVSQLKFLSEICASLRSH